jgi:lactoylglutathione lyase
VAPVRHGVAHATGTGGARPDGGVESGCGVASFRMSATIDREVPVFTESFPILSTRDLPRLVAFYRDVLGFTQTYRFPADGQPQYVGLRLGASSQLGIVGDGGATSGSHGQRLELCLYADDCDAAVARLRAGGAVVTSEPQDMPWGERAAHAEDPDGNRLVILSRPRG